MPIKKTANDKKAKAEAKARKETAQSDPPEIDSPDENKETKWLTFWGSNAEAREITTQTGEVRGGMGPVRIKKAKALLKEWGF